MRINSLRTPLWQTGDTIVEVLISIAVVSLVLAGAYASTNRNTLTTQDTQEHSQALQLVQSQIESMRVAESAGSSIPNGGCFDTNAIPASAPLNVNCHLTIAGAANCNTEPCYQLQIQLIAGGNYSVSAAWNSLLGNQDNVTLYYRP